MLPAASAAEPATSSPSEVATAKSTSLFNGKDLTGWHVDVPELDKTPDAKPTFIVRDGLLVSLGQPAGHLITDAQYENYRLVVNTVSPPSRAIAGCWFMPQHRGCYTRCFPNRLKFR